MGICGGACEADVDMDGVCDDAEILGCDDETACNYDPLSTENDGSCTFAADFYDCAGVCLSDASFITMSMSNCCSLSVG